MMTERPFSKKSYKINTGYFNDFDKEGSHDPMNEENIDYEEWSKFISFYRHHL